MVALLALPFFDDRDGTFEVTASAGDTHFGDRGLRQPDRGCPKQDSKLKSRGKDLAGNHTATRHVRTQCERAKRTLSSSTQATMEIDALLDGADFPFVFSEAWFKGAEHGLDTQFQGTR